MTDNGRSRIVKKYFDPKTPGSFSSIANYIRNNKHSDNSLVQDTIKDLYTYGTHRVTRNVKKGRRKVVPLFKNEILMADLADVGNLSPRANYGTKFILVIVDALSKMTWFYKLKNKKGPTVAGALQDFFKKHPDANGSIINTDRGAEFRNRFVQAILDKYNAKIYHTFNIKQHTSYGEWAVKRLKTKIHNYLEHSKGKRYVHVLNDIQTGLNREVIKSIGMRPFDVKSSDDQSRAWANQFQSLMKPRRDRPRFKVGDLVRISRSKLLFEKSYSQTYSPEIFKVTTVVPHYPIWTYKLEDLEGHEVESEFLSSDLSKVTSGKNDDT